MNIAVCDDNSEYINRMEGYFCNAGNQNIAFDIFSSGEELLDTFEKGCESYDAVFLDMEMGGINGIETANLLREKDRHILIVFITAHTKYMKECFECLPFRFLVKPVSYEMMEKLYYELYKKLSEEKDVLVFTENRYRVRLFCEDILYIECHSHLITIYTRDGRYQTYGSLGKLLKQDIYPDRFARTHKSFVVNVNYILRIFENELLLHYCDTRIPLSRNYKRPLLNAISNNAGRKSSL